MKYLVRFGSLSDSKVVELNDDELKYAKECGYQVAPMNNDRDCDCTDVCTYGLCPCCMKAETECNC